MDAAAVPSRRTFLAAGAAWLASASLLPDGDSRSQPPTRGTRVRRLAALYDIHGNLPALEAVLTEIQRASVDAVIVGGDVFPGPMAAEALSRLAGLQIPVHFIRGNGDRVVLAARSGGDISEVPVAHHDVVRWGAQTCRDEDAARIATWPGVLRLAVAGVGEVLFCHATPRSDTEIFTRLTADSRLIPIFADAGVPLVVCGHTHMQFDRTVGRTRIVNAGSVGMPFGEPGAYWVLLGPGVELRRTAYDLARAAERIRATRYPRADEFATRNVLDPPSEQQMLAAYSRVEVQ